VSVPSSSPRPSDPRGDAWDEPAPAFRDAEAWLAERGIERDPIDLGAPPEQVPDRSPDATAEPGPETVAPEPAISGPAAAEPGSPIPSARDDRAISARDALRLAEQSAADARLREDEDALPAGAGGGLEDDVAEAIAFVRASTSAAPQSEGRLGSKLADRGWSAAVIEATLDRARRERLVDDPAMAAALVAERRSKGHAVARIRRDLRDRGFADAVLEVALGEVEREDPEAAAFAVARDKAAGLTGLTAETAFRRVVGHVARRGYPEGLARKVAREAVFTARDAERTAGH
jgi:regulatory protein